MRNLEVGTLSFRLGKPWIFDKGCLGVAVPIVRKEYKDRSYVMLEEARRKVSIKDTGAGIPPDNLDKVFEPFFSTKPVGRGTGLGLSLSYGIIEAHRGKLEIKSQTGKGTEVKVILPVEIPEKE